MNTQLAAVCIVGILSAFSMIIYLIYRIYESENPYVDEIHEESDLMEDDRRIGKCYTFKRTYKNGTIKYIRKTLRN